MPATVKVRSTGPHATHAVYLARGRDRAGNEYGEPWVPFAPGIR